MKERITAIFLSAILFAGALTIASPTMVEAASADGKDRKDKKECYRDDRYYDKDHRYYQECKEYYQECKEYYEKDKKHRDYRKGGQYYEECKSYYEYTYKEYDGKDREYKKDDRKVKYDKRDKKDREYKKYDPRDKDPYLKQYDREYKEYKDRDYKKYDPKPNDKNDNVKKEKYNYDEELQFGKEKQFQTYDPKPNYKKYGKYVEEQPEPPKPPMKHVLCPESGFITADMENCPVKCDNGLFVMHGMKCPEIPEQFPVCDNGIVVNSTEFCPQKCETGEFEGFYVMNQEQCPTTNGNGNGMTPVKSDEAVCETCLLLTMIGTGAGNFNDLATVLATGMTTGMGQNDPMPTDNAWEVCSAEDPDQAYAMVVSDEFGQGIPDPIKDSEGVFNECLCEAGILPIEECEAGTEG
ncbi:MAG: hypothetical protein ACPKPY_10900 [Nitrososphaeraceae archaeon]